MNHCCLAIDLGASSGRIMAGTLHHSQTELREIHRFPNPMLTTHGTLCWDIERISGEIIVGLQKCVRTGLQPVSIGVDSWGVDFVLLDKEDRIIGQSVAYRDARTDGIMDEVFRKIPRESIYRKTGIQFQQFNSLYQLYALRGTHPEYLQRARSLLFIPDYINFLLTGIKSSEYTIASTSQLLDSQSRSWDDDLTELITTNDGMFLPVSQPGEILGNLLPDIEELTKLHGVKVISVAGHDTASAVAAVPAAGSDWAYISSGTWSLMGIETERPVISEQSLACNFTNEGGINGTYRVLKNLMGLWLLQGVRGSLGEKFSFDHLVREAEKVEPFRSIINPNDSRYFNPPDMVREIQESCRESGQPVPGTPGEMTRCILDSLALQYRQVLEELRGIQQDAPIRRIHIVGGGCQNELLNQLCADVTGLPTHAGPVEATALGNLMVQNLALGKIESVEEGRRMIAGSFDERIFLPRQIGGLEKRWLFFRGLVDN